MKTTLVKERIDDLLISSIVAVGVREGGTVRDLDTLIIDRETATQAIQKLVDEECIKARIDCLKITHGHMHTGTNLNDQYFIHNITMLEAQLRATESPLKPKKEGK